MSTLHLAQVFFFLPGPPNFLSKQLLHWPQSSALQPLHALLAPPLCISRQKITKIMHAVKYISILYILVRVDGPENNSLEVGWQLLCIAELGTVDWPVDQSTEVCIAEVYIYIYIDIIAEVYIYIDIIAEVYIYRHNCRSINRQINFSMQQHAAHLYTI